MADTERQAEDDKAPHGAALLLIDMINDLDFERGEALRRRVEAIADTILGLRGAAEAAGLPIIYINDNFGLWHGEREMIVQHCLREDSLGKAMVERLRPRDQDFFLIKPQFSGFYATSLPALLPRLGVSRLILCGVAADICVLFTAADAHMREYDLWVPGDAVASSSDEHRDWALGIMAKSMSAEIRATGELRLEDWLSRTPA